MVRNGAAFSEFYRQIDKWSNLKTESEVVVFHDETKDAGGEGLLGHVLLFVPERLEIKIAGDLINGEHNKTEPIKMLFSMMEKIREKYNAYHKLHFKKIAGKKWTKYNQAEREIVELAVEALKSKNSHQFNPPLFCKLAVIFFQSPEPENLSFYGGEQKKEKELRFSETLLRILLKGAVHYLYDESNRVKILKIITDGEPYHRKLSEDRILWRLIEENLQGKLRNYVDFSSDAEIIHLDSDHKKYDDNDSDEYVYANMLQIADMLLGSVIQSCLKGIQWQNFSPKIGESVKNKKNIIAYPVKEMLDKKKRGKKFSFSGHYKSFTISKAYIEDGRWIFENITTKEIEIDANGQLYLFGEEGQ